MKPQCLILKAVETKLPSYIKSELNAKVTNDYSEFLDKSEKEKDCNLIFIDGEHSDAKKAWERSVPDNSKIFLHLPSEASGYEDNGANLLKLINKIEADNETIKDLYFKIDNL